MGEVVNEFEVTECLDAVLGALIEEVAREELLLRPPDVGDVCWMRLAIYTVQNRVERTSMVQPNTPPDTDNCQSDLWKSRLPGRFCEIPVAV